MSTVEQEFETRCLSSLAKVFADEEIGEHPFTKAAAFSNEVYSFQVAFRSVRRIQSIRLNIVSDLEPFIAVRTVGLAPSEFPCYHDCDSHILRATPGLYPDPLYPIDPADGITALPGQWRSLWITVNLNTTVKPGNHSIRIEFAADSGQRLGQEEFELHVISMELPEQQLIHTEWFHTDCLATYYQVDVFSERHWELIDLFVQTAAKHGMNMILTPLFTPPLDTEVGGERPTVQLVEVEKLGQSYRFGFEKLRRWIDLCSERGIRYFEFSHFFTQWGAKHAPKVIATENGEQRQIFGWKTDAAGGAYTDFLNQFLPRLIEFLKWNGLQERSYFHISDEPNAEHLDSYSHASELVHKHLADFPVIDALSDYLFYEKGLVKKPIPANSHIEPFIQKQVPNLWVYYYCRQYKEVANRFFNMPSARNRILGMQLYKYNIEGFLHWGYNFWYTEYSRKPVNPFQVTDAGQAFPSGDSFLVYPGENGPIESLRLQVLYEALQDLRALQLLESFIGRKQVLYLLEEGLDHEITFRTYPRDPQWLLSKREQINQVILDSISPPL